MRLRQLSDNDDWLIEPDHPLNNNPSSKRKLKYDSSNAERRTNAAEVDGKSDEDSGGPPITYAKVENFQRMKLDLSIDIASPKSKSNEPNRFGGIEDNTVGTKKRESLFSDKNKEISLTSQHRNAGAHQKPSINTSKKEQPNGRNQNTLGAGKSGSNLRVGDGKRQLHEVNDDLNGYFNQ